MKKIYLLLSVLALFLSFNIFVNAKELNTNVLDLRTVTSNSKGDGWSWDNDTDTLTLNNYNSSVKDQYGIDLPDKNVTIILKGTNNITCESNGKVRAIVIGEGDLTIKGNGTLNIKMNVNSDSAIAVATINGKTNIEAKKINIDIINTNETGISNGIYSSNSVSINNGNHNVNITGNGFVRAINSGNELSIDNTNLKANIKSNNNGAVLLMSAKGDTAINNSNLSLVSNSYEITGAMWAYYDLKISNSKINIKSTSSIDYNSDSDSLSLKNDTESRISNAYGIWAENNVIILNTDMNIKSNAKGASTSGVGCFNGLEIKESNININTNNENGKYDYGIGYAKKIIIDDSNVKVNSKESAIFSFDSILLTKANIQDNGIIMSTTDGSKQTIGLKDAVITSTNYNVTGALNKVVIKRTEVQKETAKKSFPLWIIGLIILVVVGTYFILKKKKDKKNK